MKLFTVGPVEMYPETLAMGGEQIPYFRNDFFSDVVFNLGKNMKTILNMGSEDRNIILTSSGTGAMEAVIINCIGPKDKVLLISGGNFGKRFEELCEIHNIRFDVIRVAPGEKFDEKQLDKYEKKGYTTLLVNIHETSIGQLYPIDVLSEFCVRNHMFFIVDAISSVFADYIDFTYHNIDALIYSSQKALALAPGISVVALSSRMIERLNPRPKSMYFDFNEYLKNGLRGQTPFTPAIGIILQMNQMLELICKEGIDSTIKRTHDMAVYFRKGLLENGFELPDYPLSNAMTPIWFGTNAQIYYRKLIEKYNINVNPCGGELTDKMLRVGHMGNLKKKDFDSLLSALCGIRGTI